MPNDRRAFVPGGCWFFTVNVLERRKPLLVEHIGALRHAVIRTQQKLPFRIDDIVVLPDHMHAIWTFTAGDDDFSSSWRLIKSGFARALPKLERLGPVRIARNERGIWHFFFQAEDGIRDYKVTGVQTCALPI